MSSALVEIPRLPAHTVIAAALAQAVPRIGPPEYVESAAVLLWLDLDYHDPPLVRATLPPPSPGERRSEAAACLGVKSNSFARHTEPRMLRDIAEQLLALAEEITDEEPDAVKVDGLVRTSHERAEVRAGVDRWFTQPQRQAYAVKQAHEILGVGRPDLFTYRAGTNHPLYVVGEPHPDDRAALIGIAGDHVADAFSKDSLHVTEDLHASLREGLVLVGSPEAEAVSRLAFGYEAKISQGGMRYTGETLDLPYRWEEDLDLVEARYARFVPGKGRVNRPNWPVVDQRRGHGQSIYPRVRRDGLLDTDLLLITRVPNFLTRMGYQQGRSIVSIAGSHGTATRAISLVLRDLGLLRELNEYLSPGDDAFQILIEVGGIVHDPHRGSRATKIRLRDVQIIGRSDASWDDAAAAVKRRLPGWRAEVAAASD